MATRQDNKSDADEMILFRQEAARLLKEFDSKIQAILEDIREKKLEEVQQKIQT